MRRKQVHVLNEEAQERERFYCKEVRKKEIFQRDIQQVDDNIIYCRKNIFVVPSRGGDEKLIKEIAKLINLWTDNSSSNRIFLKAINVMPVLLLKKENKNSKAKDHFAGLERRQELWENENIMKLPNEGESIQEMLLTGEGES